MFGEADLPTMFDAGEFGEQATIGLPVGLAGVELVGIFDAEYLFLDTAEGMESAAPALWIPDVDIPAAMATALNTGAAVTLTIRGTAYGVVETKPDGAGVTVLRLRK
jgi:hypothetical protein